jgi:hypothetical protein
MQFSIPNPNAGAPTCTATTTIELREAVRPGGLQATIAANANFVLLQTAQQTPPQTRAAIQGTGGVSAAGTET